MAGRGRAGPSEAGGPNAAVGEDTASCTAEAAEDPATSRVHRVTPGQAERGVHLIFVNIPRMSHYRFLGKTGGRALRISLALFSITP